MSQLKSWNRTKCVILNCGASPRDDPEVRLFEFPKKDSSRYNLWVQTASLSVDLNASKKHPFIFNKHSHPGCFGKFF